MIECEKTRKTADATGKHDPRQCKKVQISNGNKCVNRFFKKRGGAMEKVKFSLFSF